MRALAPVVPEAVSAGIGNLKVDGVLGAARRRLLGADGHPEGSYGGRHGLDGMDAVDTLYANTRNNPIEDIESHYPLRIRRYELREDVAGPGAGAAGSARCATSSSWRTGASRWRATATATRRPGLFGGDDGRPAGWC